MYCRKCGAKLNDNTVFCTECGEKVIHNNYLSKIPEVNYSDHKNNTYNYQNQTYSPKFDRKSGRVKYFAILQVIVVLVGLIWINSDSGQLAVTDMMAYVDGGETYIDMVKTVDIKLLNTTYGNVISQNYYNCKWSYFKDNNDDRIVELNCIDRIDGSAVCVQFILTPLGNDLFYIEPCYLSVNGVTIQDVLSWIYSYL